MTRKLPSGEVLKRYGITRRTLGRWMVDPDLGFPKPITLNGRHYSTSPRSRRTSGARR